MRIIPLGLEHEKALGEFLGNFESAGEKEIPAYFGKPEWSHSETVQQLEAWGRGEQTDGFVANSTRFLEHGDQLLGVSNFRHELNDKLLAHGGHIGFSVCPSQRGKGYASLLLARAKDFARGLSIDRILVTCDRGNPASAKVIERSGGVLEDVRFYEELKVDVCRNWIDLRT